MNSLEDAPESEHPVGMQRTLDGLWSEELITGGDHAMADTSYVLSLPICVPSLPNYMCGSPIATNPDWLRKLVLEVRTKNTVNR